MNSCNYQNLMWQCINWQILARYIDTLKTRIYKASLKKSRSQAYYLQSIFVNSPLVMIAASKCYAQPFHHVNCFELGHLAFCLSYDFHVDTGFYHYYRENSVIPIMPLLNFIAETFKLTTVAWCVESCQVNALFQKRLCLYRPDDAYLLNSFVDKKLCNIQYAAFLDLKPCFSYFYLSSLVKRLSITNDVRSYLRQWLKSGVFAYIALSSNVLFGRMLLATSNRGFFCAVMNIFISFICSEISAIFDGLNALDVRNESISLIFCKSNALILCKKSSALNILLRELRSLWLFSGIRLSYGSPAYPLSLSRGIQSDLFFLSDYYQLGSLHLDIAPSLYSQLALMTRISSMLNCSVSYHLSLLIIRLNKLLLTWSSIYFDNGTGKIFYLVDYLIYVKLRLFLRQQDAGLNYLSVALCGPLTCPSVFSLQSAVHRYSKLVLSPVSTHSLCRHYISIKTFWIYTLKCLSN